MIVKLVHVMPGDAAPQHVEWIGGVERVELQGDRFFEMDAATACFSSVRWIGDGPWYVVWVYFEREGRLPAFVGFGDNVGAYLMSDAGDTIDRLSPVYG